MRISVAMATYNGADFLEAQLESFANQSLLPDELVVSDDGSTDKTLQIMRDFMRTAPFEVAITQNQRESGTVGNFGNALEACRGDAIFISDQDDVWLDDKIERMLDVEAQMDGPALIVCDARFGNEDLSSFGGTVSSWARKMGAVSTNGHVNGCCTLVNRAFADIALPIPPASTAHDIWLHTLAVKMKVKIALPVVLQYYRRHDANVTRGAIVEPTQFARSKMFVNNAMTNAAQLHLQREAMLNEMQNRVSEKQREYGSLIGDDCLPAIERELSAVRQRCGLLEKHPLRRIPGATEMLLRGGYGYFSGWQSFLKDCLRR